MSVFNVLLRKELREIRRTWRIWVLPAILLFIAITSPILAQITPALVRSLASNQPGVVIELPDPTPLDAYRQLVSQLSQIGLLALIITTAGIISSELRSGTAILVLTKPVSRRSFVLAKLAAQLALLTGATILATLVCWVGTLAIFGEAAIGELAAATALWLLVAAGFLCLMTILSTLITAQAGAAGAGIAAYFILSILAGWGPAQRWTPAGALRAVAAVIDGAAQPLVAPVLTTLTLGAIAVAAAIYRLDRSELAARARES